jgi:hypothetical protein
MEVYSSRVSANSEQRRCFMRFENSVAIDKPVEDVFEYVTTMENLAVWQGTIIEAKQTSPDPVEVGSTGAVKAKFLGRRMEIPTEITAWNPPQNFSTHNTGGPIPITSITPSNPKDRARGSRSSPRQSPGASSEWRRRCSSS